MADDLQPPTSQPSEPSSGGTERPAPAPGEGPKIHVDTDWKAQAKAEKERLARQVEGAGRAAAEPAAETAAGPMPPASFAALVQTLATQAALFLSPARDPHTGRSLRNLDLAKFHIDLLSVLEEKTRGNLTEEEKRLLDRYLYDLRMAYVSAAS